MKITKFGICQVSIAPVRKESSDESEIVTQLLFGDYVEVVEEGQPWIKIYFPSDDYHGYMDFKQLFYISEAEFNRDSIKNHPIVNQREIRICGPIGNQNIVRGSSLPNFNGAQITMDNQVFDVQEPIEELNSNLAETALTYLNTPYLWGGKNTYGIDCSGFTQIVAKLHGIKLPRDASKQVHVGKEIPFSERKIGDLIYFINAKDIIHHVGFIVEENKVIHASGHVRIDAFDEKGIFRKDLNKYTHVHHSIKRI